MRDLNTDISYNFRGKVRAVVVMKGHDAYNMQLGVIKHPETKHVKTRIIITEKRLFVFGNRTPKKTKYKTPNLNIFMNK